LFSDQVPVTGTTSLLDFEISHLKVRLKLSDRKVKGIIAIVEG
jgi:hypothetical protein